MTLFDICKELRNWFEVKKYVGRVTISNDSITVVTPKHESLMVGGLTVNSEIQNKQYFRIVGSVFNDGVYQKVGNEFIADGELSAHRLTDETFYGAVWAMAIPKAILDLKDDMTAWADANADVLKSPYQSESFGGYSYTKASNSSTTNGDGSLTWQTHFAQQLNRWRKI